MQRLSSFSYVKFSVEDIVCRPSPISANKGGIGFVVLGPSQRYNKVALMSRDLSQQVCNNTDMRTFYDLPRSPGAPFNDLPQSGVGNVRPRQLEAP